MGDKLRNIIGLACDWSQNEISTYKSICSEKLGPVYMIGDIEGNYPKDNPADRARFLDKKLKVDDNCKVENMIIKIAEDKGKAMALINLEQMAIQKFY